MTATFDKPFTLDLVEQDARLIFDRYNHHITRRLSNMAGQFLDQSAYQQMLSKEDSLLYEVYDIQRPVLAGELQYGISIVHPGKVGEEYYMTKGHFHTVLETAEVYLVLRGTGYMIMETPEGEWAAEVLQPHKILYVPPRWAHRSVNTGKSDDLVTYFVYPGHAGHDYGSIERQGFRKLVVEQDGLPALIDNPRWLPPEQR